jgi:uridylate kinase
LIEEEIMGIKYKRILLKLSGEGLMGNQAFGIDEKVLQTVAESVRQVHKKGVELCLVIGGGNFYRGVNNTNAAVARPVADQAGMLATLLNALFLKSTLNANGVKAEILSGIAVPQVAETYSYRRAQELLKEDTVLIFAGGTGNPYFTTDTGATLRALETGCEALFKATQVDGVYDSDPKKNPSAKRYDQVSYNEVIEKQLKVMDITAVSMARENNLPVVIFKQESIDSLIKVLQGKGNYTIIK